MARAIFLVVCDKDENTARKWCASKAAFCRQILQAWSQRVNQKLLNGFIDIAVPYLTMGTADGDA